MTRAELRRDLSAFRAMVRERGPRECLEVASVQLRAGCFLPGVTIHDENYWDVDRLIQGRLAARAALRWWRWANRDWRFVTVSEPSLHGTALYVRWYSENR